MIKYITVLFTVTLVFLFSIAAYHVVTAHATETHSYYCDSKGNTFRSVTPKSLVFLQTRDRCININEVTQ